MGKIHKRAKDGQFSDRLNRGLPAVARVHFDGRSGPVPKRDGLLMRFQSQPDASATKRLLAIGGSLFLRDAF